MQIIQSINQYLSFKTLVQPNCWSKNARVSCCWGQERMISELKLLLWTVKYAQFFMI